MAAPFKTGLNSFQFDVDFFADDRIEALSGEFGMFGELAAIKLLCTIYRNGYYIEWSELHKRKLAKSLPGIELQTLEAIIEQMIGYGFFDRGMFDNYGVLTSVEIQENYLSATRRRKNIKMDYCLVNVCKNTGKCMQNANINGINDNNNSVNVCNNIVNVDINPVNDDNNSESSVLPDSAEQSEPVARNINITAIDVTDSYDVLELNNNSKANNNLNQEKERKVEKKEKEVELALPYFSPEFVATWNMLRQQPKWKKKTQSALQMSLNKLGKYPEEFAVLLMENAIAGGWQGVVFTWTPDDFRKWQAQQTGIPLQFGNKKPKDIYESNMESMNEAFRLIDEKYGT